jgi:HEPN domain-containing protein
MSDRTHALHLLTMAERDLRAFDGMGDATTFTDEIAGFHAQQAAEKTLKAWLAAKSVAYSYTHDLSVLLQMLADEGEDIQAFRPLVRLNAYAVFYRYDVLPQGATLGERAPLSDDLHRLIARVREALVL